MTNIKINGEVKYEPKKDLFDSFKLSSPLSVCWQITRRCNLSCPYCISNSGASVTDELSTKDACFIIEKLAKAGVKRIDFSGGEPLLRKDLPILLDIANKFKLGIVVTTNGTKIDEKNIKILKKKNAFVQVSLEGPKEIHENIRGEGTFELVLKSLKLLKKENIPTRINTLISKKNKNSYQKVINIAKNVGINSIMFIIIAPQGRCVKKEKEFCLTYEEDIKLKREILQLSSKFSHIDLKIHDYRNYLHSCFLITPNGTVISQSYHQKDCITVGNLLKDSVNDLWCSGKFNHLRHLIQYLRYYDFF